MFDLCFLCLVELQGEVRLKEQKLKTFQTKKRFPSLPISQVFKKFHLLEQSDSNPKPLIPFALFIKS